MVCVGAVYVYVRVATAGFEEPRLLLARGAARALVCDRHCLARAASGMQGRAGQAGLSPT